MLPRYPSPSSTTFMSMPDSKMVSLSLNVSRPVRLAYGASPNTFALGTSSNRHRRTPLAVLQLDRHAQPLARAVLPNVAAHLVGVEIVRPRRRTLGERARAGPVKHTRARRRRARV